LYSAESLHKAFLVDRPGQPNIKILIPNGTTRLVQCKARTLTIGRDSGNDLVLDDKKVSSHHLSIEFSTMQVRVTDLASTNGTFIENIQLKPNEPHTWAVAQTLRIGQHTLLLVDNTGNDRSVHWRNRGRRLYDLGRQLGNQVGPKLHVWAPAVGQLFKRHWGRGWGAALIFTAGIFVGSIGQALIGNSQQMNIVTVQPAHDPGVPTFTSTPEPIHDATHTVDNAANSTTPAPPRSRDATKAPVGSTLIPTYTPTSLPTLPAPIAPQAAAGRSAGLPLAAQAAPRDWDPRLDQLGVTWEAANVAVGQPYWQLIRAQWQDEAESAGKHHIYVNVLDEKGTPIIGQSVTVWWSDNDYTNVTEEKAVQDESFNYQMYAAGYSYSVKVDGLPSDSVHNLGLGDLARRDWKIHTSFLLTFQRSVR
jgi:hypothetical protein